ncbi:MAG: hypothetical protein PHT69_00980 [Bacteroidales bacterium]|nr:hypothetical protein [Bacteroidales bacterium]
MLVALNRTSREDNKEIEETYPDEISGNDSDNRDFGVDEALEKGEE